MPPDLTNNNRPAVVTRPVTPESGIFSAGSAPARMKAPVGAPRMLVAGRFSCEHQPSTRPVANSRRRRDAGGESGLRRALICTWLLGVGGVGSEREQPLGLRPVARSGSAAKARMAWGIGGPDEPIWDNGPPLLLVHGWPVLVRLAPGDAAQNQQRATMPLTVPVLVIGGAESARGSGGAGARRRRRAPGRSPTAAISSPGRRPGNCWPR